MFEDEKVEFSKDAHGNIYVECIKEDLLNETVVK